MNTDFRITTGHPEARRPRTAGLQVDVFAEAKLRYTVYDLWQALNLPGEPGPSCRSPFRDERHPSFSIFDEGRAWKDHGTGEGGDVIAFVQAATGWSHSEIRDWFMEPLGIDHHDPPTKTRRAPETPKVIEWPCELLIGAEATWAAFATLKGLGRDTVWVMTQIGFLRFALVDGHKCYVVLDDHRRATEIRRLDGQPFHADCKAYPLKGVDKSWMPGAALIKESPGIDWVICEGASDYLHLVDLYLRYRRAGGSRLIVPMTMLGAGVKRLDPAIMTAARGLTIILIPDADKAGDQMGQHWIQAFTTAGADVEIFKLPRGKDLRDVAGEISPEDLFDE